MKEYYFLLGEEQKGPFTIEELKCQEISKDTLIWKSGAENWEKAIEFPEIFQKLKSPPPPPTFSPNIKSELKTSNQNKVQDNSLRILIIWISFHLFALLMSYSEVNIFNDTGTPTTEEFWPFVSFTRTVRNDNYAIALRSGTSVSDDYIYDDVFNGLFTEYDWTEFSFYSGVSLLLFFLKREKKD